MKIITKEEFLENKEFYLNEMHAGKIFIYPTDTIYGIGCDATNKSAVLKVREIKHRDEKPFSVIAPSKDWIKKNCHVEYHGEKWIAKLPGAYTLILELRNWEAVDSKTNCGLDNLGVRIPDNWFSAIIGEFGKPFVTTSVNLSGEKPMASVEDCNPSIADKVDYIIDDGVLAGKPSTIVKLLHGDEEIIKR
jgi:L-threonylcarbamoyladenylate synthase